MKKLSIFFAVLATLVGFSSCEDDKTPVLQTPTQFVLNTPALANQYYELQSAGTVVLTCSQPDYGFIAPVTYGLEVALTANPTADEIATVTPETPSQARMEIPASKLAEAMCSLMGLTSKDDFDPAVNGQPMPLYCRATAIIGENEGTLIKSNWITLQNVITYPAIPEPNYIYLVGQPEGWKGPDEGNAEHYADWRLFEKQNDIGSNIYWGVFDIAAGQAMFRFYSKLSGWDAGDSWGYQVDDSATDFEFDADGNFQSALINGKGSFNFPNWPGGLMTICVNMSQKGKYTVSMMAGDQLNAEE